MFNKPLISEFFTTISFRQAISSLSFLSFNLKNIRHGKSIKIFEYQLLSYLWSRKSKILSFYDWRSGIYNTLKLIWITKNDEIIINWYTCSVVINAVIQSKWKIIYSDIEEKTLSLDYNSIKKNITNRTKAIIIQHTFWKQARDYNKILKLAKKNNILVIEDCAHSLWNKQKIKWDFAIFSTWRDKVISSITWWFLIINNKKYFKKIYLISKKLKAPSIKLIIQNLSYNIIWFISYKLYNILKIWKIIIYLSRKLNLITEILNKKDKNFESFNFNFSLSNSLASLANDELKKIDEYNNIRLKNSEFYINKINNKKIKLIFNNLNMYNWFRYPILLKSEKIKNELYIYMKNNGVLLWNSWSWNNIIPLWTNLNKSKYIKWSCYIAENISSKILTLPNHKLINLKDLEKIVKLLNNFKK